jgi:hypothetical protein
VSLQCIHVKESTSSGNGGKFEWLYSTGNNSNALLVFMLADRTGSLPVATAAAHGAEDKDRKELKGQIGELFFSLLLLAMKNQIIAFHFHKGEEEEENK